MHVNPKKQSELEVGVEMDLIRSKQAGLTKVIYGLRPTSYQIHFQNRLGNRNPHPMQVNPTRSTQPTSKSIFKMGDLTRSVANKKTRTCAGYSKNHLIRMRSRGSSWASNWAWLQGKSSSGSRTGEPRSRYYFTTRFGPGSGSSGAQRTLPWS